MLRPNKESSPRAKAKDVTAASVMAGATGSSGRERPSLGEGSRQDWDKNPKGIPRTGPEGDRQPVDAVQDKLRPLVGDHVRG